MPRSLDDREEALGWYARWRLEQEAELGEARMAEVRLILGGGDMRHGKQILYQMRNARGAGIIGIIRLADVLGVRSPGTLVDNALSWWERAGRGYRDAKQAERPPQRRTKSGPRPAAPSSAPR